jgi:PAS domain S-box-containing protein
MLGYSEQELRRLSFDQITHPDDLAEDLRARNAMLAGETDVFVRVKRYIRKNGTPLWVQLTGSKTERVGDDPPYVIIGVQDISEQMAAETALAARVEQQAAVMQLGQLALAQDDPDTLIQATAELVAETLGVDACMISRFVAAPGELEITAASEGGKKYLGWVVQPKHRETGEVFAKVSEDAVIWNNTDPDSPDLDSPILRDFGTKSAASVVIGVGGAASGVLVVHSKTNREFTNDDLTFLKSIVNVLAAALTQNRISSALAERENMLNTVLDTAADGIIVANADGDIVMSNNAAEDIFGYAADELARKNLRDLVPVSYDSGAATGGTVRMQLSAREMVGVRHDGTRFPIEVAMTHFDGPDGIMHTALVRDITEQKNLQSQLIQASKLATVGEMAAGIAHELNQPLNIMRMAADNVLIRQDAGTADLEYAAENLELISEQAGRMGKIILHMRVFSRQETSDFEPFDPAQSVRNACDLIGRQLELDNVELNVDIQTEGVLVNGIGSQLEQVLINMITNGRDAIRENATQGNSNDVIGSVDVCLEHLRDEQAVSIRVRDTGGGIAEKTLERIFDPFFTTKEVGVGTGLGLSVSYGIVNSMGGQISAQNIEGGCEFCVRLPTMGRGARSADTLIAQAQGLQ